MLWKVVDRKSLQVLNNIHWDQKSPWSAPQGCILIPEKGDMYAYAKFVDPTGPVQVDKFIARDIHRYLLLDNARRRFEEIKQAISPMDVTDGPLYFRTISLVVDEIAAAHRMDLSHLDTIDHLIATVPEPLKKYWKDPHA